MTRWPLRVSTVASPLTSFLTASSRSVCCFSPMGLLRLSCWWVELCGSGSACAGIACAGACTVAMATAATATPTGHSNCVVSQILLGVPTYVRAVLDAQVGMLTRETQPQDRNHTNDSSRFGQQTVRPRPRRRHPQLRGGRDDRGDRS